MLGFYPFCSQKKEQIGTFSHARAELKADPKKEAEPDLLQAFPENQKHSSIIKSISSI